MLATETKSDDTNIKRLREWFKERKNKGYGSLAGWDFDDAIILLDSVRHGVSIDKCARGLGMPVKSCETLYRLLDEVDISVPVCETKKGARYTVSTCGRKSIIGCGYSKDTVFVLDHRYTNIRGKGMRLFRSIVTPWNKLCVAEDEKKWRFIEQKEAE